ncbi:unnamed protein product [Mytilus edulis]|uniref:Uncharacterized protein n=1 Tax=Mytilus edulis TaxID=6550 RepID=A0A8S3PQ85_MYTED|nr:unnamed protein product [Mytilus edulis]
MKNHVKLYDDITIKNRDLLKGLRHHKDIDVAYYYNGSVFGKTKDGLQIIFDIFDDISYRIECERTKDVNNENESVKCLDCQNVAQPYDCTTVTECGRHEECYTRKEITDDGNIYYNVGCKDEQVCRAMTPFGKRDKSKRATTICDKCCNSDLCNLQSLCGSKDLVLGSGETICFACNHGITASQTCNKITLCPQDQQCNSLGDNSNDCTGTRCCSQQLCNTKCDNTAGHTTTMQIQTNAAQTTPFSSTMSTTTSIPVTTHQEKHTTQRHITNSKY